MFKPLTQDEIVGIIDLVLEKTAMKLADQGIGLEISDRAKQYIASESYTPVYGARPVKRFVQKNVETEIARMIIRREAGEGSVINVDAQDGSLRFSASLPGG